MSKYKLEVKTQEEISDFDSPRNFDNIGTMYCLHKKYNLGDDFKIDNNDCENWDDEKKQIEKEVGELAICLPLSLYDHSGISMSVGVKTGWDSGQVGFIFATKEKVRKEYNVKRITKKLLANVEEALRNEVKTYNAFLNGDIYEYIISDEDNCEIESCCGFFEEEDAREEGLASMSLLNKELQKNKNNKLKIYIKNKVPIEKRVF